ncbi:MAG: CDGSH iron-sulfur domain-containing protein [Planctomycetaceae bacterium]|nr:CDGSH iron-sulfur domain-containing protein [Planctomycetota bacterium]NUN52303.1 CDGSH iron-sulfur domain-containing protein [Planctomycetaceae bacterium]
MADVTVQTLKNGPLLVKGPIRIQDAAGNAVPPKDATGTVALCRCGASKVKPFCDGSHKAANFQG